MRLQRTLTAAIAASALSLGIGSSAALADSGSASPQKISYSQQPSSRPGVAPHYYQYCEGHLYWYGWGKIGQYWYYGWWAHHDNTWTRVSYCGYWEAGWSD